MFYTCTNTITVDCYIFFPIHRTFINTQHKHMYTQFHNPAFYAPFRVKSQKQYLINVNKGERERERERERGGGRRGREREIRYEQITF